MRALYYRMVLPFLHKFSLLLSVIVYVAFVNKIILSKLLLYIGLAVMTTIGFMAIGYLSNDLADIEKDKNANKPNSLLGKSSFTVFLLFAISFVAALVPWFFFKITSVSVLLIVAELLCFFIYAFPPFRLKEKGFWGLVTDSAYAHVIPTILAAYTFYLINPLNSPNIILRLLFFTWLFLYGIRNILSHQISDFANDIKSDTITFVTKHTINFAKSYLFIILIPLEFIFFCMILLLLSFPFNMIFFLYISFIGLYILKKKFANKEIVIYSYLYESSYYFYNGCISNEFYERYLIFLIIIVQFLNNLPKL